MSADSNSNTDEGLENKLRMELDEALLALDELAYQDPEEALAMFDTLPEPVQALPDFQLLLARANQALEQLDASRDLLEGVLKNSPNSAEAHHLLGDVLEDLGDSASANAHFIKTLSLDSETYSQVAAGDRDSFEALLDQVATSLSNDVSELTSASVEKLPSEQSVIDGQDPRAFARAEPNLILFAANLYAELGDLLGEPNLASEVRRVILLELAEAFDWSAARRSESGLDDPSESDLDEELN